MEERILIEYYRPIKELNDGSEDRIMNKLTRTEAINRMAKAFVEYEKTNNQNACEWTDLKERAKDIYRERAKAALNALLEEK